MTIARMAGDASGRSRATVYRDLVWAVAVAADDTAPMAAQTRDALAILDDILTEAGSGRSRILSATVYIADMAQKAAMDAVWGDWIGPDPAHWPQRACVGTALAGGTLVEIVLLAARE